MRQHGEQTARNRIGDYRPSGVSFSAVALIAAGVLVARPDESAFASFNRSIRTAPIGFQAVVKPLRSAAKHRNRSAKAQSFGAISYAQPIRKTASGGANLDSGKSAGGTIVDDLGFKPHAAGREDAPPLADVTLKLRDRNLGAHFEGDSTGLIPRLGAEESSVHEVKIRAAALDDRIVLTATESRSVYSADPGYLYAVARSSTNPKFMGKERFLFMSNNEGFAGREKLEVKLLRLGDFSASVFATNTHVDMSYYTPPAAGRDGVATPFAAGGGGFRLRDRASVETGAQFRYGAFGLTSSFWKGNIADRIGEHAEARMQHTLSWSMQNNPMVAAILPAPLARLAPVALRAGIIDANGEAPLLTPGVLTQTKSVVAGAEWEADGISVDVDYYSYRSVSGSPTAGPSTSQGAGVSANAQVDLAPVTLKASGSISPGTDSAQGYRAKSNSYSASLSMAYRAKDLPDLSIDANLGRYAYREGGDGWSDGTHSQYWNTTASLDIAKFLVDDDRERTRLSARMDLKSLKMFYRYEYFSDAMLYGARAPNKGTIGVSLTASIY